MIRPHTQHRSRGALIAARLAVAAVVATLVVGCGDDDSGRRVPTATSTPPTTSTATRTPPATPTVTPPNANASTACTKLVGCKQCFSNSTGQCIGTDECAGRLSGDVAICINGVTGCDQTALGDCLFFGCDGTDASGECQ